MELRSPPFLLWESDVSVNTQLSLSKNDECGFLLFLDPSAILLVFLDPSWRSLNRGDSTNTFEYSYLWQQLVFQGKRHKLWPETTPQSFQLWYVWTDSETWLIFQGNIYVACMNILSAVLYFVIVYYLLSRVIMCRPKRKKCLLSDIIWHHHHHSGYETRVTTSKVETMNLCWSHGFSEVKKHVWPPGSLIYFSFWKA